MWACSDLRYSTLMRGACWSRTTGYQSRGVAGGPVAHGAVEEGDDLIVVDVAGDGDDGVGGDVLVVDEVEHGVAG